MYATIFAEIEKEIAYGVKITVKDFVPVSENDLARVLRAMVHAEYGGDDAGVEYFYDKFEGIICIGGTPGWWDNRSPMFIQMLELADRLDGRNYQFDYSYAVSEITS